MTATTPEETPIPAETESRIRAERFELLLDQSYFPAYLGIATAAMLTVILWPVSDHWKLSAWMGCILFTGVLRLAVFSHYRRTQPGPELISTWERRYFLTMLAYFLTWGLGGIWIMPADAPLHQFLVGYFLIALAGSAIGVFSVDRKVALGCSLSLLIPVQIWLYSRDDVLSLAAGVGTTVFLLSAIRASGVLSSNTYQNLKRKHQILHAKSEADALASALADALATAEEVGGAKTRFLASASHDLRQPIHTLGLLSAALVQRPLDDRSREISAAISNAVGTLAEQLDALLDVSKLDAGVIVINESDFSLSSVLAPLFIEFRDLAESHGIDMSVDCPEHARVFTDRILLERILRNLMINAIKHNQNCKLSVSALGGPDSWQLSVMDTGTGIPEEEQQRVFEEFYQLGNPERDRAQGLGLGLAIVQRLQGLLKLDMQLESSAGRGTCFTFHLPGSRSPESADSVPPAGQLAGLTVLVVDDEAAIRGSLKLLLEGMACAVELADGTAQAIEVTSRRPVDAALVDYRLPGDDSGIKAITALREVTPELPAILITGDIDDANVQQASREGLLVLSKPVARDLLVQSLLKAILRSA